jgi:hypothetical protein
MPVLTRGLELCRSHVAAELIDRFLHAQQHPDEPRVLLELPWHPSGQPERACKSLRKTMERHGLQLRWRVLEYGKSLQVWAEARPGQELH